MDNQKRRRSSSSSSAATSAPDLLSSAVDLISSKSGKSSLKTLVHSLSPSSTLLSSLPSHLSAAISRALSSLRSSSSTTNQTTPSRSSLSPPSKRSRHENRNSAEDSLRRLRACAYIVQHCITHPKNLFSPSDLFPVVQSLHDSLVLFESDDSLLSEIAAVCEHWWKDKLPDRESLIPQSIPYLISRSLTLSRKIDVKRIYGLREALQLFDYDDDSIEDMKMLLIRCVIAPVYLKTEEGRKFIAFTMGLNMKLTKESLAMIKSQIPFGRKSVLEAYADVIFRAWKGSEGNLREEIENFLQGLIDGAVHASNKSLSASVRRVLGGFIQQRATDGVDKLLFQLAEPVLFRSLQVANSNVRQNALHLFLDLFPLEDPDATKEGKDTLLNKQFLLLDKLLLDDCPDVRVIAVEGCCRILHMFWEIIPSSIIAKFLAMIIDKMSHDMSNDVRLSTVKGLIYLLENPQSHEILKVLLPRIAYMFSDRALSVRLVVADLLLAVRDIQTLQFNKVVGLEALLYSLAYDHPSVAQKITRLLIPSYFPSKANKKEACRRCMTLMKRSPAAWTRFCEYALSEGSSPKSLMELLRVCVNFVLLPKDLNSDQIDTLCIASANICHSLLSETSYKKVLGELFTCEKMKCLLGAAVSDRAKTAIISITSLISPSDLSGFREQCMALTTNNTRFSEDIEKQALIRAVHKLMYASGWFDKLFDTLTAILQTCASGFVADLTSEGCQLSVASSKRRKEKSAPKTSTRSKNLIGATGTPKTEEEFAFAAAAAWQVQDMLSNPDMRNSIMKSSNLETVFSSLKIISQFVVEKCSQFENVEAAPLLAYLGIAICMSVENSSCASSCASIHIKSTPQQSMLDSSLEHLLNCANKILRKPVLGEAGHTSSAPKDGETTQCRKSKRKEAKVHASTLKGSNVEADPSEAKRVQNVIKLVTAVLKLIVDSATMNLLANSEKKCLQFALSYVRDVVNSISKHQDPCFRDEELKDMLSCLRSSYTYIAKLLHLVLTSRSEFLSPPEDVFHLSSDLINLITSVELHIGSYYASLIVSVAKPWLPILILGLCSKQLVEEAVEEERFTADSNSMPWLDLLGKCELSEIGELNEVERDDKMFESDLPMFKKLMELIAALLRKGSPRVMDAVGCLFLHGVRTRLERAEFPTAAGLVHFVFVKLLGKEYSAGKELRMMLSSFREINLQVGRRISDPSLSVDARKELEILKLLLNSADGVWHVHRCFDT